MIEDRIIGAFGRRWVMTELQVKLICRLPEWSDFSDASLTAVEKRTLQQLAAFGYVTRCRSNPLRWILTTVGANIRKHCRYDPTAFQNTKQN